MTSTPAPQEDRTASLVRQITGNEAQNQQEAARRAVDEIRRTLNGINENDPGSIQGACERIIVSAARAIRRSSEWQGILTAAELAAEGARLDASSQDKNSTR